MPDNGPGPAPPYYLVNKVLTVFMKGDSKVTYKVLESTVKRAFSDAEIAEAKKLLWERFPPEDPNETKVDKGKWIERQKLEFMIEDIYKRLAYLGNNDQLPQDCICVPWNQIDSLPDLETDEAFEVRAEKRIQSEVIKERFKQLEAQNTDIVKAISELKSVITGGGAPKPHFTVPDRAVSQLKTQVWNEPSSPLKRKRVEDPFPPLPAVHDQHQLHLGSHHRRAEHREGSGSQRDNRERSRSRFKAVSGNHSVDGAGVRKMKVAPVDIFIYGCHKDTSPEDIVEELKFSDIVVTKDDIEEKTREHSNVKSFKIAIKAEYLEKALKPETWPMRVKVREWVYYPKRKEQQPEGGRLGQRGGGSGVQGGLHSGDVHNQSLPLYKNTTPHGTAAGGVSSPSQ